MRSEVITVRTGDRPAVRDITGTAMEFVAGKGDACCTCSYRTPPPGSP